MDVTLILPAAGFGRRMGGTDKLLEDVDGQPILRALAERGLAAGLGVRVTVPALDHPRAAALEDLQVSCVAVADASKGMSASLRVAFEGLETRAAMILPADMPEITVQDLRVIAEAEGHIVRATSEDGEPGHPVRFDRAFFPELQRLEGDNGARAVLEAHAEDVVHCALPGRHAIIDLDTPESWADWRAGVKR